MHKELFISAGRRPTVFATHLLYTVGNVLTFAAPSFWYIAVCRFLVGMAHHTVSHLPFLLSESAISVNVFNLSQCIKTALEYCGVEYRTIPLLVMMSSYTAASLSIPFLTVVLPAWHYLLILATVPNVFVLLLYKFIPESPSWLMCRGHFVLAKKALKRVAKANGKDAAVREKAINSMS